MKLAITVSLLLLLSTMCFADLPAGVTDAWKREYGELQKYISDFKQKKLAVSPHLLDKRSAILEGDETPAGVVIRRTEALLEHMGKLRGAPDLKGLKAHADRKLLIRKTVGKKTAKGGWLTVDVDLSPYAGKKVMIELINQPNGWSWETGYWAEIDISSR